MEKFNHREYDTSNWNQCAKLSPADLLKRKAIENDNALVAAELELLESKAHALQEKVHADSREWWFSLYKTYGLMPGAHKYHITDDGRILMSPKREKVA